MSHTTLALSGLRGNSGGAPLGSAVCFVMLYSSNVCCARFVEVGLFQRASQLACQHLLFHQPESPTELLSSLLVLCLFAQKCCSSPSLLVIVPPRMQSLNLSLQYARYLKKLHASDPG